eukprot:TRINITY_DN10257_c0_g1_i4.p1 TRINITY_DN10257_c0_g1~~TRINITY_DN10257_c0_g1_i4.p1  ORF type:complete len:641 (+),score=99.05 TRINITY_DN10257_c0_g1_i4:132-2054(+)
MIRRPPRSTLSSSSAASDVYKRQVLDCQTASAAVDGSSPMSTTNAMGKQLSSPFTKAACSTTTTLSHPAKLAVLSKALTKGVMGLETTALSDITAILSLKKLAATTSTITSTNTTTALPGGGVAAGTSSSSMVNLVAPFSTSSTITKKLVVSSSTDAQHTNVARYGPSLVLTSLLVRLVGILPYAPPPSPTLRTPIQHLRPLTSPTRSFLPKVLLTHFNNNNSRGNTNTSSSSAPISQHQIPSLQSTIGALMKASQDQVLATRRTYIQLQHNKKKTSSTSPTTDASKHQRGAASRLRNDAEADRDQALQLALDRVSFPGHLCRVVDISKPLMLLPTTTTTANNNSNNGSHHRTVSDWLVQEHLRPLAQKEQEAFAHDDAALRWARGVLFEGTTGVLPGGAVSGVFGAEVDDADIALEGYLKLVRGENADQPSQPPTTATPPTKPQSSTSQAPRHHQHTATTNPTHPRVGRASPESTSPSSTTPPASSSSTTTLQFENGTTCAYKHLVLTITGSTPTTDDYDRLETIILAIKALNDVRSQLEYDSTSKQYDENTKRLTQQQLTSKASVLQSGGAMLTTRRQQRLVRSRGTRASRVLSSRQRQHDALLQTLGFLPTLVWVVLPVGAHGGGCLLYTSPSPRDS